MTAIAAQPDAPSTAPARDSSGRTIWGLTPTQLHDRFWAARGVQVVRQGERSEIVEGAELFLLTDPRSLVVFRLGALVDTLSWLGPDLMVIRLRDHSERGYRERVIADRNGRFQRFERLYGGGDMHLARVALTSDLEIARQWQAAPDTPAGWRALRRRIRREHRVTASVAGRVFDRTHGRELVQFMGHLVQVWKQPDATIGRARQLAPTVWSDRDLRPQPQVRFIGSVWVGAGRELAPGTPVVGPAVLWDRPEARPPVEDIRWQEIEPTDVLQRPRQPHLRTSAGRTAKRALDLLLALLALALTLPLYPLIMLAIWIEDGRPFFFLHARETMGGRPFPCIKFRSMRRDAERVKAELAARNKADGPQFYLEHDPRLTRVGRLLRKLNIDEWPQFVNVLLGHMSMVGPRPSPFQENQFCPAWREARLSVRPGITGLWQVMRSRRQGLDFQEWIRYDIQYVEKGNWQMDLWIIWRTMVLLLFRSAKP